MSGKRIEPPLRERLERETLHRLYVTEQLTTIQIAERVGSNRESVRKLILAFGIPMRSTGAGMP